MAALSLTRAQVLGAFPELWDEEVDGEPGPTPSELRCDRAAAALIAAGLTPDELDEVSDSYSPGSKDLAVRLEAGLKALRAGPKTSTPTDAGAVGPRPETPRRGDVPLSTVRPKRSKRVA